jgi:hypothetical protein
MAKDSKGSKSAFPKAVVGGSDAAKAEADKVSAKIDEAFDKLAKKMLGHADKAEIDETKKPEKRIEDLTRAEMRSQDVAGFIGGRGKRSLKARKIEPIRVPDEFLAIADV